jgi:hypothetical protein
MSAKQRELVRLALLSAVLCGVAWDADYPFATFIFGWLTAGALLLLVALRRFGDDAYEQ